MFDLGAMPSVRCTLAQVDETIDNVREDCRDSELLKFAQKEALNSPCPAFKRRSADAGTLFVNRHNKQHTMSVYAQDRYRPLALVSQRLGVPLSHSDHDQIQKSGPGATCDRENSGNTQRIQRALCHSHLQNRLRSKPRPHPLPIPSHTLRGGMSLA